MAFASRKTRNICPLLGCPRLACTRLNRPQEHASSAQVAFSSWSSTSWSTGSSTCSSSTTWTSKFLTLETCQTVPEFLWDKMEYGISPRQDPPTLGLRHHWGRMTHRCMSFHHTIVQQNSNYTLVPSTSTSNPVSILDASHNQIMCISNPKEIFTQAFGDTSDRDDLPPRQTGNLYHELSSSSFSTQHLDSLLPSFQPSS